MRSKKDRIRSAVALSYETARHAVAYEKTRQKPEDVMATRTATQPGAFARIVQKVAAVFRRIFGKRTRVNAVRKAVGYKHGFNGRKMNYVRYQKRPPKLYRHMERYRAAHPILPMKHGEERRKMLREIGA